MDLTPDGDTRGALVNKNDPRCIEIWNLVFIQFNANPDGSFTPLPQRHVDTGMGFERAVAIIQGTRNLTDFSGMTSNYETDVFRPIFDEIERLSGKKYASTLPHVQGSTPDSGVAIGGSPIEKVAASRGDRHASGVRSPEQIQIDVAFRVIADHIRALSFAIADGIIPSNEGRGYVLRRILRRAVRYGRTLDFHEPFFFKLVDVLAKTMGDVFPEVRTQQLKIKETIRREEEAFNKTLDRGIELFEREVTRILGSAGLQPAPSGILPDGSHGARYTKRRLPHYERPHGIYHVIFSTRDHRVLSPEARSITLNAIIHFDQKRYDLFATCVMPDHVHILFQPWPKPVAKKDELLFWSLAELMHSIKSFTAREINRAENSQGKQLWENEYHDRLMRSDHDVEEKFLYLCRNPWTENLVRSDEDYPWVWEWSRRGDAGRQHAGQSEQNARAPQSAVEQRIAENSKAQPKGEREHAARQSRHVAGFQISGEFAFKLYDTYGFPLDLTELMARERGLTVDVAGFERLMDEQRERARRAQKKEEISVEGELGVEPTKFLGYDFLETEAVVEAVLPGKKSDELNVVLDRTPFYAEMGGQVGDRGLLHVPGHDWTEVGQLRVINTQKRGDVFVHRAQVVEGRAPEPGEAVRISVDADRRKLIQGHHTVTHLLHWALHQIVSRDATQKGSYVGPDKLTFDFSSAPLTSEQKRDVEKLVNEKIADNAAVSWTEIPFAEAKQRKDIIQFFGEKYGDRVRVLQIGGAPQALNGYSMELCGGTHVRSTGEIGPFRIVKEEAIAAGTRRIEAVAGDAARVWATQEAARQQEKFETLARKKPDLSALAAFQDDATTAEVLKQIDARAVHLEKGDAEVREWEKKTAKSAETELKSRAAKIANELAQSHAGKNFCVAEVPDADGKLLQAVVDALKSKFKGPIFLAGTRDASVALVAYVPPALTAKFQANKLIQQVAPIVGGKGGGRPESAQGAGKDASKINEALAKARELLS
jgi:alanyl-tRNA synthetase/REP element-mobilizing transposase RayT